MNDQPLTRREARDLERRRELQGSPNPDEVPVSTGQTPALEPNTLVVETVPDITNLSLVLGESGAVLTTGPIELSWLKADTGQTQVVAEAADADSALAESAVDTNSVGITPIPARQHERTRRKASVFQPDCGKAGVWFTWY